MVYDREIMQILDAHGYEVHVYGDMHADIFYGHRFVARVDGEWGLFNWMSDMGWFDA